MSEDPIDYIQSRLKHWAEWYSKGNGSGLGYLSCSIEYRLMTEGMIIRKFGPSPLACNEEAEEIETLLREMSEQNKHLAAALRHCYLNRGGLRIKGKSFNVTHQQFKIYMIMGHHWLAGRMSLIIQKRNKAMAVSGKRR